MTDTTIANERRMTRLEAEVSGRPTHSHLNDASRRANDYTDKTVQKAIDSLTTALENQFELSNHRTKEAVNNALQRFKQELDHVRKEERREDAKIRAKEIEAERVATEERVRQEVASQVTAGWKTVVSVGSIIAILFMGISASTAGGVSNAMTSLPIFGR